MGGRAEQEEPEDDSWNYANIPLVGAVVNFANRFAGKRTGHRINRSCRHCNNPNVNGGLYRTAGGLLGDFGGWLEEKAAAGEKYHPSQRWNETSLSVIVSNPDTLIDYLTDQRGFSAELGNGLGKVFTRIRH